MDSKLFEFTGRLENVIRDSISGVSGHEWDEDFITRNLLRDLRNELSGSRFIGRDRKSSINWQIYKLKGTFENNFGDVALIVNINYQDGTSINGAAFLEAKKRDWRKITFGAMKLPQAKKILKNAPRSQYLLYDYEEITGFLNGSLYLEELSYYYHHRGGNVPFAPVTRAVCVPLNLAVATTSKDTLLYRHSVPFSQMLSNRYFQGLDLEFDDTSKKVATGFLKKFGLPKFIVKIDIAEPGSDGGDNDLRVNPQEYQQID
ncbi:hypothetical protein [Chrysiogenes arsenatis]|uniref:hypothetical protein n=1 Tax=Chrysiogenes arsenatis TaxID=309797 RepID=UPI0004196223|nr:hypothetical protein [Chrysiogenes arsenatis]